jgi:hypothetical protein
MTTLGEDFGLTKYSDDFINKIVAYRMDIYKNRESGEYYSYDEIAKRENCNADDVREILTATGIMWNH